VSELHLTLEEFYDTTPRAFIKMIDEWKGIQIYKAQIVAHIANGGDPEELRPTREAEVLYNCANIL
jgi:hypothetical protein